MIAPTATEPRDYTEANAPLRFALPLAALVVASWGGIAAVVTALI